MRPLRYWSDLATAWVRKKRWKLRRQAGCRIEPLDDEGEKVFFPQALIEQCLRSAPKRLILYNRRGEPKLDCEGRNSYFSPTSACPKMWDPYTGDRRPWTKDDIGNASRITDYLPQLDAMFALGLSRRRLRLRLLRARSARDDDEHFEADHLSVERSRRYQSHLRNGGGSRGRLGSAARETLHLAIR